MTFWCKYEYQFRKKSTHSEVETAVIIDGAEAGCDHDPATIYSNQYESYQILLNLTQIHFLK